MPLITEMQLASQAARQVELAQERVAQARAMAADGRRLRRMEDDPAAGSWLMDIDHQLQRNHGMNGTQAAVSAEYSAQEAALEEALGVMAEARRVAVGARNPNVSFDNLSQWEVMMRQLQDQLVLTANTQATGGRYLFAGTTDQAAPFTALGAYGGNQKVRQMEVEEGVVLPLNLPGDVVFGATGVDNAITVLSDAANQIQTYAAARRAGGDDPVAYAGIGSGIDLIDVASRRLRQSLTAVGARQRRLQLSEQRRERGEQMLVASRQLIGEVDMVEGAQRLQRAHDQLVASQRAAAALYGMLRPQ